MFLCGTHNNVFFFFNYGRFFLTSRLFFFIMSILNVCDTMMMMLTTLANLHLEPKHNGWPLDLFLISSRKNKMPLQIHHKKMTQIQIQNIFENTQKNEAYILGYAWYASTTPSWNKKTIFHTEANTSCCLFVYTVNTDWERRKHFRTHENLCWKGGAPARQTATHTHAHTHR